MNRFDSGKIPIFYIMGDIIYWGILRTAAVIAVSWFLRGYMDYQYWWPAVILLIYGVIIYPAVVQYRLFRERTQGVRETTLCSFCKHFEETAVLCTRYDEHPTEKHIPCGGMEWEPKSGDGDDLPDEMAR